MILRNKVAIVTGAAHGIGRAIADRFAEAGANVIIADLEDGTGEEVAAGILRNGGSARFSHCDVSSETDVVNTVALAAGRSGTVDILVNNAAFIGDWHDAATAPREEWDKCVGTILLGAQNFSKAVLPLMVERKSGSIINISSIQGLVGGRNSVAYTTVKHGLIGFTRSVAYDFGPHNIRANAICPGAIRTRISPPIGSELYQRQVSKTFLGRTGEPHEVAAAALFLASDEASYITGAVLAVDGGWTAM